MPRVPEYKQDQSLRPIFRQGVDVHATPESFGAAEGRGLSSLAAGMENASTSFAKVQDLEDTARAKEADNSLSGWIRERMYGENGFMTMEGRNAVDGRAAFDKEVEEKRKEIGQNLPAGAGKKYQQASTARVQSTYQSAIVHTANQRKAWVKDASSARLNTFAEDAVAGFNDPKKVMQNIAAGQSEIREQANLLGWDADTTKNREAEYVSTVHLGVAERIMTSDPVAAKAYYDQHKDQLTGPHQAAFEEKVKTPLRMENVKRNVDTFMTGSGGRAAVESGAAKSAARGDTGAANVIRGFEGFKTTPYWDVNAYRIGFGSDTITKADGTVVRVTPGMSVTREDAERDLSRRIDTEFVPKIVSQVGQEAWSRMPGAAKAALASVAYNYGSLPFSVANAVAVGDVEAVAKSVEKLRGHNGGINANRRDQEASIIRGMSGVPATRAASVPRFDEVEGFLSKITDPTEREMTRKSIYAHIESQNKSIKAQRQAYQQQAFNLIETKNISPFSLPAETKSEIGMEGMSALMTYWEKHSTGEKIVTDDKALYDLQTLYATDPHLFGQINLLDYKNVLSKEDFKRVNDWRQTALTDGRKAKEEGLNLTSAFSQAETQLKAVGVVKSEKNMSDADRQRVAQFQNALASEMEAFKRENNNKKPTPTDIQSMVNRLLLPVVIKTPGLLWDSKENKRLFDARSRADGATVDVNVSYSDIPIDLRRGISLDLERELGRKPSQEEVTSRYESFVLNR